MTVYSDKKFHDRSFQVTCDTIYFVTTSTRLYEVMFVTTSTRLYGVMLVVSLFGIGYTGKETANQGGR